MRFALMLLLLSSVALAGCGEEPPATTPVPPQVALITPSGWTVTSDEDHVLVWARNPRHSPVTITWRMEGTGGGPLPSGWSISSEANSATLQAIGSKSSSGGRYAYPDWAWTLFTISVPSSEPAAEHSLQLNTSHGTTPVPVKVLANRSRVSHPGDTVDLRYDGKFNDDGVRFDDGEFSTKLGSGQTVPGFDYGLMGLAKGEKAALIVPPALAYGYDNTDPNYVHFNGETLRFDVEILAFR